VYRKASSLSSTYAPQRNEVLAKIVACNLTCLVSA
jgi:hypothetical protein